MALNLVFTQREIVHSSNVLIAAAILIAGAPYVTDGAASTQKHRAPIALFDHAAWPLFLAMRSFHLSFSDAHLWCLLSSARKI